MATNPNDREINTWDSSLLTQAFDITMLGVLLTTILTVVNGRLVGQDIVAVCCFLAASFVWRLVWPIKHLQRYFGWKLFSIAMIVMFSWWLIYQAENTRTGWYRYNVLQQRIQALVHSAPSYIVVSDCDGYITSTSDNIQLLTGYTPAELAGQHVTILMRDGPAAKHEIAYEKAVRALRSVDTVGGGWLLQGLIVVGVKHKDGHIVPVKVYAGGIRWSTDIQFKGDIDMFAIFVPATQNEAEGRHSTVRDGSKKDMQEAPDPPPVPTLSPVPSPVPVPHPPAR